MEKRQITNIVVISGSPWQTIQWEENGLNCSMPAMGASNDNAIDFILGLRKNK